LMSSEITSTSTTKSPSLQPKCSLPFQLIDPHNGKVKILICLSMYLSSVDSGD
jgi:hypothetical protein